MSGRSARIHSLDLGPRCKAPVIISMRAWPTGATLIVSCDVGSTSLHTSHVNLWPRGGGGGGAVSRAGEGHPPPSNGGQVRESGGGFRTE